MDGKATVQGNRRIAVVGDVTVDWMVMRPEGAGTKGVEFSRAWGAGFACRAAAQAGGAALLAAVVSAALEADPSLVRNHSVAGPLLPDDALRVPAYAGVTRAYTSWSPFARRRSVAGDSVWRVGAFWGEDPATGESVVRYGDEAEADYLVIDDWALGFGERPADWPEVLRAARPRGVFVKMASPLAAGPLWDHLVAEHSETLTVLVPVNELRRDGLHVGYPLSWEQISEDVELAIRGHALSQARRVVVSVGLEGAVVVARDADGALVFDPRSQEGDWERDHPGQMMGCVTSVLAGVLLGCLRDGNDGIVDGVKRGLHAARALQEAGYEQVKKDGAELRFPLGAVSAALTEDPDEFADVSLAFGECRPECSILVRSLGRENLEQVAREAAVAGPRRLLAGIPIETVGSWTSVDRVEIEGMRSVRNIMGEYVDRFSSGRRLDRPLSLAVFGPPGSGKSFAVKQIAGALLPGEIKTIEFNLSQFGSEDELIEAFDEVRDVVLEERLPLVFWDEFDGPLEGKQLGWLCHFLAPMQDGKFRQGGAFRPLGPAIFVFAGGTCATLREFVAAGDDAEGRAAKKPDFLSRLRGYVNVLGPNPVSDDDIAFPLRRALLLRALVERKAPQTVRAGRLSIDKGVLDAFIGCERFAHGARSMEAIIDMSSLSGKLCFERSSLPPRQQLALHVDADAFLALVSAGETPREVTVL